jgi:hypothetical protein
MLRESAWKKEQSILEEDSNSLSILKKEIVRLTLYSANNLKLTHQCNYPSAKK